MPTDAKLGLSNEEPCALYQPNADNLSHILPFAKPVQLAVFTAAGIV